MPEESVPMASVSSSRIVWNDGTTAGAKIPAFEQSRTRTSTRQRAYPLFTANLQ